MYSEYLEFREVPTGKKTKSWSVKSKSSGNRLGVIKWWGAWRQYCFFPDANTLFNAGCMEDIIRYIKLNKDERNF